MRSGIVNTLAIFAALLIVNGLPLDGTRTTAAAEEKTAAAEEKTAAEAEENAAATVGEGDAALAEDITAAAQAEISGEVPVLDGLTFERQVDFTYATCVDIYCYEGGYKLFDVHDDARYLLVPEGGEIPEDMDADIRIIYGPADHVYMAATAAMALVRASDGLSSIRFSSLEEDGWYVEEAAERMRSGDILFAGKYSAPDFELLISQGCDLAVESTMILHSPKIQEMLENLGIPVFIDRSSYEEHPLGRSEWVKVYGALFGDENAAESFFEEQMQVMTDLEGYENTGKTVAFFYISSDGSAVVRRNSDSIPKMIALAGGVYALSDIPAAAGSRQSSFSMTMEDFYADAVGADYLIYNSSIDSPVTTMEELFAKSSLLQNFKAVKEGNVWCADRYLYQATDITGQLIRDFHAMLTGGDESEMLFLTKVK